VEVTFIFFNYIYNEHYNNSANTRESTPTK